MCENCYEEGLGNDSCESLCNPESDTMCASCNAGNGECEKSCIAEREAGVEEYFEDWVYQHSDWQEKHEVVTRAWESHLQDWPKNYRHALLKYFGLEASFMTTQRSDGGSGTWPQEKSHEVHSFEEPLRTTLCYVHLPYRAPSQRMFQMPDYGYEADVDIQAAQGIHIDFPDATKHAKWHTQFHRALQTLDLVPAIHRSQEQMTASPNASESKTKEEGKSNNGISKNGARGTSVPTAEVLDAKWPQLVMLIKGTFASSAY